MTLIPIVKSESKTDSTFIKSYKNQFILKGFSKILTNTLIQEYTFTDQQFRYTTNGNLKLGVGFNYKFLSLSLSLFNPLKNNDIEKKGTTVGFDIQSNLYLEKFAMDFHLQSNKGYYLNHPRIFSNGSFIQRPDMETFSIGGNLFYVFNHEVFSYRASFIQNAKQLKSAGSWLFGFKSTITHATSDSMWIPFDYHEEIIPDNGAKTISNFNLGLGCGYAYTKVWKDNWFFTISGLPNLNLQVTGFLMDDKIRNKTRGNINMKIHWRGAFGYNIDKYYLGMTFVNDNVLLGKYLDHKYTYRFGNVKFIYVYRF